MISGYGVNPSGESGVAAKIFNGFIHGYENILSDILCFFPASQDTIAEVINPSLVSPHKLIEGRSIALLTFLHQVGIVFCLNVREELFYSFGGLFNRYIIFPFNFQPLLSKCALFIFSIIPVVLFPSNKGMVTTRPFQLLTTSAPIMFSIFQSPPLTNTSGLR
jgi:hypothetical protein